MKHVTLLTLGLGLSTLACQNERTELLDDSTSANLSESLDEQAAAGAMALTGDALDDAADEVENSFDSSLSLFCGTSSAAPEVEDDSGRRRRIRRVRHRVRRRQLRRVVWAFDVDGDRELSEDERSDLVAALEARCEARRALILEEFDADGDGELSDEEREAAWAARKARRQERRERILDRYDADEDGRISREEREAMRDDAQERRDAARAAILDAYDADGDGELSDEEVAVLKADIREAVEDGDGLRDLFEASDDA